ncbi:hypothetical protein F0P96_10635 [Hymenobacter busanensis]|uniref:Uncharacterized protein n=1 Tax=Hymenobacter busanensis TaxID=2607656 RepID=A0A7L4ZY91_9BACT|nr:hypothetical protein [Hymenobacter busanensis]KAA9333417.1 hypothetical protein F0P96_10635 [Hymenobacter busanensis]QHJ07903.1 hypothetical protein GUY19_11670 [Hymenobacter busanensis]
MQQPTHPALEATKAAAVAEVKGPDKVVVKAGDPPVAVPKVDDLFKAFEQYRTVTVPQLIAAAVATATQATLESVQLVLNQQATANANALTAQAQAFAASLGGYATTAALDGKANASTVQGLSQTLNTLTGTTLPGLQQTVTQHTADLGNRLRKDQADATAFPLGVPASQDMGKAVQKSELAGGIQRPYRVFQNVGSTPVSAYLRPGQTAPIVDALGLGQVYALLVVRIKTLVSPGLASTITLYRNGTSFYTQTIALASLPVVGKVLDILSLTTTLPADVVLPATITASASAGSFEIIIDGILK